VNPIYSGIESAISQPQTDIRIFGKPTTRPYRRMAVCLSSDKPGSDVVQVKERAIANAKKITVNS
jgi:phosphoribosylglycinamide formyltransferase 2